MRVIFDEIVQSSKNEMDKVLRFVRDSGIKSLLIDSTREKAINEIRKRLNEFEDELSSLWRLSIPFSKDQISNIFKRKRQIENYLYEIRTLLIDLDETNIGETSNKCERYLKATQLEFERLHDSLKKAAKALTIPELEFPAFFQSSGEMDQLADLILFCLSNAEKSLKILAPFIDEPFTRILRLIVEKKKINLEILIRSDPEPKATKEILSLMAGNSSSFDAKINRDLHARCIIVDEKYVFVHNTDFQTTQRLGRIDSGLGVEKLAKYAVNFFEKIWKRSVDFQDRKLPIENLSNAIVVSETERIFPVKTEVKMFLFNSDPSATYREFSGNRKNKRLGFIDSELDSTRIYLDLNQPSRKHIQRIILHKESYVIPEELDSLMEYLVEDNVKEVSLLNEDSYRDAVDKLKADAHVEIKKNLPESAQIVIFFARDKALLYKEEKFTK